MFRIPDLRNKIIFTLFMIGLYRLGANVTVPGIDFNAVQKLQAEASKGGVLSFLNLFSGGALTQMAVFALGIMPYITSSIIMQLLAVVIPKIEQWQQQGAVGQKKITQWTRYMTVGLAILQATGLVYQFHKGQLGRVGNVNIDLVPNFTVPRVALIVLTITAGTAVVMWMGELVTQRGIGNGMSILIFTNVVSRMPAQLASVRAQAGWFTFGLVCLLGLGMIVAIVFVEQGQRRIPVQFAKRVVGRRMYGGQSTYIPLKVNQSGVIPVIFASSILSFPALIASALGDNFTGLQQWINDNLVSHQGWWYSGFYTVLIGKPGAGKGTQAALLSGHYGVEHLSTGDIFRAAVNEGTPTGLEVQRYMDTGELVPDDIVIRVVDEHFAEGGPLEDGFILDG